jgi:hypothetical protein
MSIYNTPTLVRRLRGWLRSCVSRRVVAGIATMPSRAATFPLAVRSIIDQVDMLYLYLDGHEKVPESVRNDPRVVPIFARDEPGLGCDGKFLGMLRERRSCLYVGVDDDIIYPPNYVSHLSRALAACGSCAVVGVHGIKLTSPFTSYLRDRRVIHFSRALGQSERVDLLGSGTTMFDTAVLKFDPRHWRHKNVTDIQLAVEATKIGLPMMCITRNEGFVRPLEQEQEDSLYAKLLRDDSTVTTLARSLLQRSQYRSPR